MSARLVRNLVAALIGLVIGMVAHQSQAASYEYTYQGTTVMIKDDLSCASVGRTFADFYNGIQGAQYGPGNASRQTYMVKTCARPFVATVGDTVNVKLTAYHNTTGYAEVSANAVLTAIKGDVSDEAPESQLLIALMCCVGFSLGVIAGQQR